MVHSADKQLDRMDRVADLFHFPAAVQAGATLNVMLMIAATYLLAPNHAEPWAPLLWVAVVLLANVLPVALLRRTMNPGTPMPRLREMDFFRDQHKFSDWVYLAASAHMAAWLLLAWALFRTSHSPRLLVTLELAAALLTMSPVLFRRSPR